MIRNTGYTLFLWIHMRRCVLTCQFALLKHLSRNILLDEVPILIIYKQRAAGDVGYNKESEMVNCVSFL